MTSTIYLDHNATTPPLPEVVDEVARVMRECYGNPGSRHREGRKARRGGRVWRLCRRPGID